MPSDSASVASYFCWSCGGPLPPGWEGLFHPACLKADKRRRVREARHKIRMEFERWLGQKRCPKCGARLDQLKSKDGRKQDAISSGSRDEPCLPAPPGTTHAPRT